VPPGLANPAALRTAYIPTSRRTRSEDAEGWREAAAGIGTIQGDEAICRDVWQRTDALGNMYIWCVFLVF